MKKILFAITVATVAMTACTNESSEYVGSGPEAKEIAFSPIATPTTRTAQFQAVSGTSFPDNYTMEVSANYKDATKDGVVYFSDVTFSKGESTTWKGSQYWPLSACTLNFLAVTNWPASYFTSPSVSPVSTAFTDGAKSAVVTLGDNKPATITVGETAHENSQHDLMYAVGRGIVSGTTSFTYSGNSAGGAAPVDMTFKHALAWVNFTVKTAGTYTGFKLKSIALQNAYYGGTYTLSNTTNYNYGYDGSTNNSRTASDITGTWSSPTNQGTSITVPGWTGSTTDLTTTATPVGNGILVVPTNGITSTPSFTGFIITYEFNGIEFTFTHTENITLEQAKKYTYAITFTLTEIEINPSVSDWTSVSASDVAVPASGS